MKIVILGTGGVGGYYGGLLARHGQEVTFIARGAHLAAIRKGGLQVKSVHGDFTVSPVRATDDPTGSGPADLLLVCTKTYATRQAVELAHPCLGPRTAVVSLQNGIDASETIGALVGMEHMLGGATWLSSAVESPGVIHQVSEFRRVVVGELDGSLTPRLRKVAAAFAPTGVTFETTSHISRVLWTKFVFIAAVSGIGAITRLPIGEARAAPETRRLLTAIIGEVEALARASGVTLDVAVSDQTLAFIDSLEPQMKSSMQRDVEAGCPFELEAIIGVISRKGNARGVPTPVADMVYTALLPALRRAGG